MSKKENSLKSEKKGKMMFELFYNKRNLGHCFDRQEVSFLQIPPSMAFQRTWKSERKSQIQKCQYRKRGSQCEVDFLRLILSFDANQFWLALEKRLLLLSKPLGFTRLGPLTRILAGFTRERLRKLRGWWSKSLYRWVPNYCVNFDQPKITAIWNEDLKGLS